MILFARNVRANKYKEYLYAISRMKNLIVLIHSHTEYIDVLKACVFRFRKFFPSVQFCIVFNDATKLSSELETMTDVKYVFEYEPSTPFYSRLLPALHMMEEDYVLLNLDINILVEPVKEDVLQEAFNIVQRDNIDQLRLFCNGTDPSQTTNNMFPINSGYIMSISPAIWKRTSLLDIAQRNKDVSYRSTENFDIGHYVKNTYKSYCLYTNEDFKIPNEGHYFSPTFPAIHAVTWGKWILKGPFEDKYVLEICKEFGIDINVRGYVT